ncbi:MAG: MFS transporter [Bradyrhizobiaceae bacterium]|nr:MAG: MFS transporter [Bradyrhizobiaceae bacterium]
MPISASENDVRATTLKKVTVRIIPFFMVCYLFAYVDRTNMGFAALQMNADLSISATVYGWAASIFFMSYLLFEVPSNLILERVGARRWISFLMVVWGIISASMAFVVGPKSLYLVRFLLGMTEAGFFPGVILYLTYWFPRADRAKIIGMFLIAQPLSGFIGSPLSGALLGLDGWLGMRGWQWMFILEALPATLLGLVVLWWITDKPAQATWLKTEQRDWLVKQMEKEDRIASTGHVPLLQIMKDPRVLLLGLIYSGAVMAEYGLIFWIPQMIKEFGLTNFKTGLLGSLPYAAAIVAMLIWGFHSDKTKERKIHVAIPLLMAAVGLAVCITSGSLTPTMIALCLTLVGCFSVKPPFWAMATENLPTGFVATAIAQINSMAIFSALIGPFLIGWVKDNTGSYAMALIPLIVLALIGFVTIFLLPKRKQPESLNGVLEV